MNARGYSVSGKGEIEGPARVLRGGNDIQKNVKVISETELIYAPLPAFVFRLKNNDAFLTELAFVHSRTLTT